MICQWCLDRAAALAASSAASRAGPASLRRWRVQHDGHHSALARAQLRRGPHGIIASCSITTTAASTAAGAGAATQAPPPPPPAGTASTAANSTTAAKGKAGSPGKTGKTGKAGKAGKASVKSSVPAGAPLRGLNYLKNQFVPTAMPDADYPAWLWTCLDPAGGKAADGSVGSAAAKRESAKSKKKGRRGASEQDEVDEGPQVPLDQQSIDLPSNPQNSVDGALEAAAARDELTHVMRVRRRGSIKESNFLQGMK